MSKISRHTLSPALVLFVSALGALAWGQGGAVPFISQPLVPGAAAPGGSSFTLTVNGAGFASGAVVNWNGSPLATSFVSGQQLQATVPASAIAKAGTAFVTVSNPGTAPASNVGLFQVVGRETGASFSNSPVKSGGVVPAGIVTGDFNRDGRLDLAFAFTNSSGQVYVMLGRGDGTFGTPTPYSTGGSDPTYLETGDFNGDGNLDLVVSNRDSNTVAVLPGSSNGTFGAPLLFTISESQPLQLAVGDFNEDGKLDVAVSQTTGVSVLFGKGDGTFSSEEAIALAGGPFTDVITADFNRDGRLDLLVSGDSSSFTGVALFLGNGDGTFQNPTFPATVGFPRSAAAADLNADGNPDLVMAGDDRRISVMLGNGDGTFQTPVRYTASLLPLSVVTGDFSGDGILDVAVTDQLATSVSLLAGNGDGTFQTRGQYASGSSPSILVAGDFNGDGRLDLVNTGASSASLAVLLQQGNVTFAPASISFSEQVIGTGSTMKTTLTNRLTGGTTLTITKITIAGADPKDFTQTNTCGSEVPPGGSCTLSITFTPIARGNRLASVVISDGGPGGGPSIALLGVGKQ